MASFSMSESKYLRKDRRHGMLCCLSENGKTMPVMMASVDQRARLGVHLASEDVPGLDHHGGGDDVGDDIARHRLYAIHRNTRAHFPNLRSLDLTWSLREARSPYLHHLPR